MPRIRTVKPDFFTDRRLARDLERDRRLFYLGLWTEADDAGRFKADPRRLLGAIFPYDDDLTPAFIEESLRILVETKRCVLYEVEGEPYGQLTKFAKHQRINRPTPSKIPSPPTARADSVTTHGQLSDTSLSDSRMEEEEDIGRGNGKGDGKEKEEVAAYEHPGSRTRVGGPDPGSDDGGKVEAIATMRALANQHARSIKDKTRRRAFSAMIRVIVSGDDATAWRDPRSGALVPWSDRAPLLAVAIAKLDAGERKDIRKCLRLAVQQQKDPFPERQSHAPPAGSEAAAITDELPRGDKRPGEAEPRRTRPPNDLDKKRSEKEAELIAQWANEHPDEAESIRSEEREKIDQSDLYKNMRAHAKDALTEANYRARVREMIPELRTA